MRGNGCQYVGDELVPALSSATRMTASPMYAERSPVRTGTPPKEVCRIHVTESPT
jgi:hypothetical protein